MALNLMFLLVFCCSYRIVQINTQKTSVYKIESYNM